MDTESTFNQRIYADEIKRSIPDIQEHDLKFLCNQSASIYQEVQGHGCVDNYRISRIDAYGQPSQKYDDAVANGCCGFCDRIVKNPVTGNRFTIGFNFGH